MRCQGHTASVTSEETTVIEIDANPDQKVQYEARDDPEVAAILKSFGINKVEDYVYQDNKEVKKLVSYVMTVSDPKNATYLMKRVSHILPKFIDDDDLETIDDAIDDIPVIEKQKRQIFRGWFDKEKRRKDGTVKKRKRGMIQLSFIGPIIGVVIGVIIGIKYHDEL